jgi:hypothetical protein
MKIFLGTAENYGNFSSVPSATMKIQVKALKNKGLIKAGQIFSGVVTKNGRIELDGLPNWNSHPILFMKDGKLDSPSFVLVSSN